MSDSHLDNKHWPTLASRLAPLDPDHEFSTSSCINQVQEFTFFPLLPTELRLKIWGHTWRGRLLGVNIDCGSISRNASVEVQEDVNPDEEDDGPLEEETHDEVIEQVTRNGESKIKFFENLSPTYPVTLWVSSESRYETLHRYKDLFPHGFGNSYSNLGKSLRPTYFNPAIDSLALYYCNKERNIQGGGMIGSYARRLEVLAEWADNRVWREVRSVFFSRVVLEDVEDDHELLPGEDEEEEDEEFEGKEEESERAVLRGLQAFERLEEVILVGQKWKEGWKNGFQVERNRGTTEKKLRGLFDDGEVKGEGGLQVKFFEENFRLPLYRDEVERAYELRGYEEWDLREAETCLGWFDSEY